MDEQEELRVCEWCGKPLVRKMQDCGRMESEKAFMARRFCDRSCRGKYQRKQHLESKICEQCGKTFYPTKNDARIRFCSKECQLENRKQTGYMKQYSQEHKEELAKKKQEYNPTRNEARRIRYREDEEYREYTKLKVKRYQESHPDVRKNQRMRKYGISAKDYEEMWDKQNGRCLICGEKKENKGKYNSLFVDHNHETGKVRGLLCQRCNFLIGQARDDVKVLKSAIKYLEMTDKEVKQMIDEQQINLFDYMANLAT